MSKPNLSVILLSYNTKEVTLDCLRSIVRFAPKNIEVLILDNASTDGSYDEIKKYTQGKPLFKLFRSNKNLGFGGGNNLLVSKAKSDTVLFLNSDTVMIENCLTPCLNLLDEDPDLVGVSCNLLNKDRSVQYTGGFFPNIYRLILWQFFIDDLPFVSSMVNSIHPHQSGFNFVSKFVKGFDLYSEQGKMHDSNIRLQDWLTGAFLMVRKDSFLKVNGFDDKLFMYAEDLELCYKLKKAKKSFAVLPSVSIIHLGGQSSGSVMAISSEVKGILHFFKIHTSNFKYQLAKIIFLIGSLLRYLIFGIIKNNANARQAYLTSISYLA